MRTKRERKLCALKMASLAPKQILLLPLYIDWKCSGRLMGVIPELMDKGLKYSWGSLMAGMGPIIVLLVIWPVLVLLSPIAIPWRAAVLYKTWSVPKIEFDIQVRRHSSYGCSKHPKQQGWFW